MSTKYVTYLSDSCLPCGCQGTANVIMCTRFNATMPGQIIESTSGCGSGYSYNIQYDSADLPVGVTALATSDLTSIACKGCLTTWIEEQFTPQQVVYASDLATWDFKDSAQGDTHDAVTFTITNPSNKRKLKGLVGHRSALHLVTNSSFATGFTVSIYKDGTNLTNTGSSLQEEVTNPGGTLVQQLECSGFAEVEIAPGGSADFVLQFVSQNFTPVTDISGALGQAWFTGALSE